MSAIAHLPDCECQTCWPIVYVSPPNPRFIAVDLASPAGDFSAEVVGERLPDGRIKIISVSVPPRDDWRPRDLMGPPR